jgi:hypothetical protein
MPGDRPDRLTGGVAGSPSIGDLLDVAGRLSAERCRADVLSSLAPMVVAAGLVPEAVALARGIEAGVNRAGALTALALVVPEGLREELVAEAYAWAPTPTHSALVGRFMLELAPLLSVEQLDAVLVDFSRIDDDSHGAQAQALLAAYLSPEQLGRVLAGIVQVGDENLRAVLLGTVAPHLHADQLGDAYTAARRIRSAPLRARALTGLAPYLEEPDRATAIEAALIGIFEAPSWDGVMEGIVLRDLAGLLDPAQYDRVMSTVATFPQEHVRVHLRGILGDRRPASHSVNELVVAGSINDPWTRARALTEILPHLPVEDRQAAADQVVAAIEEIRRERPQSMQLAEVAPFLNGPQLAHALQLTLGMDNPSCCLHALGGLAPHLTPEQHDRALTAAISDGEGEVVAEAISHLAPYLTAEQTRRALAAATAIGSPADRVYALTALVPHLVARQRDEAIALGLTTAEALGDADRQAQALVALAAQLPVDYRQPALAQAFIAVTAMTDENRLSSILPALGALIAPTASTA